VNTRAITVLARGRAVVCPALVLSANLAACVAVSHLVWAAPAVDVGLRVGWVALSRGVAWPIRRRLGEHDRVSRIAQLARQDGESLNQARELFDGGHYDLSVVEGWRALEARLRQVLLSRRRDGHRAQPRNGDRW
jgi:hypothetical protein